MKSCSLLVLVVAITTPLNWACSSKSASHAAPYVNGTGGSGGADNSDAGKICKIHMGYEQIAKLDADAIAEPSNVGLVLTDDGTPLVCFTAFYSATTTLYFSAYDPTSCKWRQPVSVADLGPISATKDREVTLARDPANGRLAIAYQTVDSALNRSVKLAQSLDDGVTWSSELVAQNPDGNTSMGVARPTVAMRNGTTYYAYYQLNLYSVLGTVASQNSGFVLLRRDETTAQFSTSNVPAVGDPGVPGAEAFPPALAIDQQGQAGLAFFALADATSNNLRLVYYQTSQPKPVNVFDSMQQTNSVADVSLIFEDNRPRIAASLARGAADTNNSMIWFSASDDGTTWSSPVELPMDGGDKMGPELALASDSAQNLAIATNYTAGNGSHQCAAPKISTSTDDGATFNTCGPSLASGASFDHAGRSIQLAYQPDGKLIAAFVVEHQGVWIWREP